MPYISSIEVFGTIYVLKELRVTTERCIELETGNRKLIFNNDLEMIDDTIKMLEELL